MVKKLIEIRPSTVDTSPFLVCGSPRCDAAWQVQAGGRMARYRNALPQLGGALFLTDGGIETTLIFNEGLELPDFAAFDLLRRPGGRQALRKYFRTYAELAQRFGAGLVLESATWRANPDWGARQGYGRQELAEAN